MPTDTFFRLPEEKRLRITQAATEEFARVRYSQASMNQVIKAAGISRGSFYQYFADKEDLFQYILSLISMEKIEVYEQDAPLRAGGGIFAPIVTALPAIFAWAEAHPLYYRIGCQIAAEEPEFLQRVFLRSSDGQRWFQEYLEAARAAGQIRPDADLNLVVDMLLLYSSRLFEQYYRTENPVQCVQALEAFFDLLSRGIRQEGDGNG